MKKPTYVVGIGASAGGLVAIRNLFDSMPPRSGLAFVVVQHLSPDFKSMMADLMSKNTTMDVVQAEHGLLVEANNVYLIPPGKNLTIENGHLRLAQQDRDVSPNLPINLFFSSLASEYGERGVAVILSGTGSDGSKGVMEVNKQGGLVICQEPKTAKFDGMPRNAISTRMVNKILSPEEIPQFIINYTLQPDSLLLKESASEYEDLPGQFKEVFKLIYQCYKLNLQDYKDKTVNRRIIRRMKTLGMVSVDDYLQYIEKNPEEVDLLYHEVIIGVTQFFRDTEIFESKRDPGEVIRIWVSSCSSGEEAYSIAMLIENYLEQTGSRQNYKIFATDLLLKSVQTASQGVYSMNAVADFPDPMNLRKYFSKVGDSFKVKGQIRNNIIFTSLNFLTDPPFTKIDLACCRNALIYLSPKAQAKALRNLHFSLKKNGYLFLGASESLGGLEREFNVKEARYKFFQKIRNLQSPGITMGPWNEGTPLLSLSPQSLSAAKINKNELGGSEIDGVLQELIPNGMIINGFNDVTHIFGEAKKLIDIPDGQLGMSNDIYKLIRSDLKLSLAMTLTKARKENKRIVFDYMPEASGVSEGGAEAEKVFRVIVKPLGDFRKTPRYCLVILQNLDDEHIEKTNLRIDDNTKHIIADIHSELQFTKESLHATIEELETSNEELQSTNEELLASNEELQSTNEELQSVNEELYSVNSEHQEKILQLQALNSDIDNLLVSSGIGAIFVNTNFEIRKFTPNIKDHFNIMNHDIGRSIRHFTHSIGQDHLEEDIQWVLDANGEIFEKQILDQKGKPFLMRISRYLDDDSVTGAVISFISISNHK